MSEAVALMPTCLVDLVRPETGEAAVRVLRRAGYTVSFPPGQTCCGQPAWNSGFPDEARRVAQQTLNALAASEGPVVVLSGSCASTMLHVWPELFPDDSRAAAVLERVVEFGALLAPKALPATPQADAQPTAYHCSCHQRRGLRDAESGARLLDALPGVERREAAEEDACCGFGGTFSIKLGEISTRMADNKCVNIGVTGADAIVGGDLGCLLNIEGRLRRSGDDQTKVYHYAEVIAGMTDRKSVV